MLLRVVAILLVLLGAAMLMVGVAAKHFFSPKSYWTDQQAKEYVAASTALKTAATGSIRPPSAELDPKLVAAQQRFEKIQAELNSAITRRDYTGVALGVCGAAVFAAGVVVFLRAQPVKRQSVDDDRPFIRSKE